MTIRHPQRRAAARGLVIASMLAAFAMGAPRAGAADAAAWAKARPSIEAALTCASIDKFKQAEGTLASAGWNASQGTDPVTLPVPLKVFGFDTLRIAVANDSGEQVYRAFLPGITVAQLAKAAKLKPGKDSQHYSRATKLGVLSAGTEEGVTALTCTIDTEG